MRSYLTLDELVTNERIPKDGIVVFKAHPEAAQSDVALPLPDARLLALHATCARAVRMREIEELDKCLRGGLDSASQPAEQQTLMLNGEMPHVVNANHSALAIAL